MKIKISEKNQNKRGNELYSREFFYMVGDDILTKLANCICFINLFFKLS